MAVNREDILKLPVEERLELVSLIWDSIADDAQGMPLSDAEKRLIDDRVRDMDENPDDSISWSEARESLLRKF